MPVSARKSGVSVRPSNGANRSRSRARSGKKSKKPGGRNASPSLGSWARAVPGTATTTVRRRHQPRRRPRRRQEALGLEAGLHGEVERARPAAEPAEDRVVAGAQTGAGLDEDGTL